MKAVRFHDFGGPAVLRYEDVERPTPGAGQVRIRVAATSFNGIDAALRSGRLQGSIPLRLPHTPGPDVTGTVDALGAGVDGDENELAVGDAVIALLPMDHDGGAAEYAIAPAQALTGIPRNVPLADAAALPLVGLTAWQALFDHGRLTAGQRVLINGAGGTLGGYAVQLAEEARAHVIATAGPRDAGWVGAVGADEVIGHATEATAAMSEPVDLVVNLASATSQQLAALLPLVRDGGRLVNAAVHTAVDTAADREGWMPAPCDEPRGVHGIDVFVRSDADQLADLVARVCTGELLLDVTHRVALADLPALHSRADAGTLPGKVVVVAHPT
ncbi:NADP-dependent oxidoreductase [Kineococcus sp. SYSU DK005]|uniref:NADP-dependent oxidoreductase n=1 Tax=Kineococcus sp. SYSU DK005 TaxID=3383126 RepID=UPI003D7EF8BE